MQMYACLCGRYNLCADYAATCIRVWQIMQMYSCLCGRYNMCGRMGDCMQLHACLYDKECCACMPVWQILQLHACVCGKYSVCSNIWDRMQPHASLCRKLWYCMAAYGADPTCVAHYGDYMCGIYSLCSRMCDYMHTAVADYVPVSMPVWQVQPA